MFQVQFHGRGGQGVVTDDGPSLAMSVINIGNGRR
jgi:hypothetical protein